jgi:hypothetical protein
MDAKSPQIGPLGQISPGAEVWANGSNIVNEDRSMILAQDAERAGLLIARSSHEGSPGQRRDVDVSEKSNRGLCMEVGSLRNGHAKTMYFWLPT